MDKDKIHKLLKDLEWSVYEPDGACQYSCPCCYMSLRSGHWHDCLLNECLKELEEER